MLSLKHILKISLILSPSTKETEENENLTKDFFKLWNLFSDLCQIDNSSKAGWAAPFFAPAAPGGSPGAPRHFGKLNPYSLLGLPWGFLPAGIWQQKCCQKFYHFNFLSY